MTAEEFGVRLGDLAFALTVLLIRSAVVAATLALGFHIWQPGLAYGAWFIVLFGGLVLTSPITPAVRYVTSKIRAHYVQIDN